MSADREANGVREQLPSAQVGVRHAIARAVGVEVHTTVRGEKSAGWLTRHYRHELEGKLGIDLRRYERRARAVAIHEGGHCLVGFWTGHPVEHLAFAPGRTLGGYFRHRTPVVPTRSTVIAEIATLLAGEAADIRYSGDRVSAIECARQDYADLTRILDAANLSPPEKLEVMTAAHMVVRLLFDACWPAVRALGAMLMRTGRVEGREVYRFFWNWRRRPSDRVLAEVRKLLA